MDKRLTSISTLLPWGQVGSEDPFEFYFDLAIG